jgi:phosphoglucomutase/phosphomannomutase
MSNAALGGDASASALDSLEKAIAVRLISAQAAVNVQLWLTQPQYAEYMPLVSNHISAAKWSELEDAFWTTIPFGTAGRRGKMYPIGTNAINDRTIGESAQGLADYVRGQMGNEEWGVGNKACCAISYDTRHRSRHFAELCAEIMVAAGFDVLMFDGFRATPELSFTVRDRSCACGIMISASHNPPADNAIKVFWSTGGQLKEPHDKSVIACVERVTQISRTPFASAIATGRVQFCQDEMDLRYQAAVLRHASTGSRDLKILYSPLHGVGLTSVVPVLRADRFTQIEVYQPHAAPDGDFPNVPGNIANPENPAVFDDLIEHAGRSGADVVIASDPDADRIGCAAPLTAQRSEWATLTGTQIGALLADLLMRRLQSRGQLTPDHYVVKTLVTSDMVCRIADHYGIRSVGDVLTGFKWIGSKIDDIDPDKFVFGFEEAHGYLAGTYTRDKDAAVAAMLLAELAAECKLEGRTLHEQLDQLFLKYGYHLERTISNTLPGADGLAKMQQTMQRLRASPPAGLGGMKVTAIRDYLSERATTFDGKIAPSITGVPPSDLLIFHLEPAGNHVAVRPSGTEPKLKFYLFAYDPPASSIDLPETKRRLTKRLDGLEADLLAAANPV